MALEFDLNRDAPAAVTTDCVVVGAFADHTLTASGSALDDASGGGSPPCSTWRRQWQDRQDHDAARPARHHRAARAGGRPGRRRQVRRAAIPQGTADAARALKDGPVAHALFTLSDVSVTARDGGWAIRQAAIAADHACYHYTATLGDKAKAKRQDEPGLRTLSIRATGVAADDAMALAQGHAIAAGVTFARELGNLPPNVCNPGYLAEQAMAFASRFDKAECEVLDRAQMQELGMGSLLAVSRGSANPPRLIVLKYHGAPDTGSGVVKPYVLVARASRSTPAASTSRPRAVSRR